MPDLTTSAHPKFRLFDDDGLPWTSRLDWGWLAILSLATAFAGAILIGLYLALWLRRKTHSALAVEIYSVIGLAYLVVFLPLPRMFEDWIVSAFLALWIAGAFIVRYRIIRYYSQREGIPFRINPLLTAFFSVWYISGCLRADFPLDGGGKVGKGVLRLNASAGEQST